MATPLLTHNFKALETLLREFTQFPVVIADLQLVGAPQAVQNGLMLNKSEDGLQVWLTLKVSSQWPIRLNLAYVTVRDVSELLCKRSLKIILKDKTYV